VLHLCHVMSHLTPAYTSTQFVNSLQTLITATMKLLFQHLVPMPCESLSMHIGAQSCLRNSVVKNSPPPMEPTGSLLCSLELATGLHPGPDKSSSGHNTSWPVKKLGQLADRPTLCMCSGKDRAGESDNETLYYHTWLTPCLLLEHFTGEKNFAATITNKSDPKVTETYFIYNSGPP
jgi:hypothetical protein